MVDWSHAEIDMQRPHLVTKIDPLSEYRMLREGKVLFNSLAPVLYWEINSANNVSNM